MSKDNSHIESELKALSAKTLDPSFLDRVDSCADDTWTQLSGYERHLEKELQQHQPSALSDSLMDSLLAVTKDIPFPDNETIVSFPAKLQPTEKSKTRWWSPAAAAAAVAMVGAFSALLVPINQPANTAGNSQRSSLPTTIPSNLQGSLIPAEFSRNLTEATDEGIIWQDDKQPHRVVKVVYHDRVTMKDTNGKTYKVEQPRVEYYMVPTQSD